MTHIPYPSIEQFRQVVVEQARLKAKHSNREMRRTYRGTVKIHGTNAAIRFDDGVVTAQSRTRDLTVESDNYGFAAFVVGLDSSVVDELFHNATNTIVFGEWCGKGIQATHNLAMDKVSRRFVMFDFPSTPVLRQAGIYSVLDMPTWYRSVDFADPSDVARASEEFAALTEQVDAACPAGAHFGVEGVGEGIVWTDVAGGPSFKVKGKAHTTSKVAQINVDTFKAKADLSERVSAVVTDARIEQALHAIKDGDETRVVVRADIPDLIRWVVADVLKEESDVFDGVDEKTRNKAIGNFAANALRAKIPA